MEEQRILYGMRNGMNNSPVNFISKNKENAFAKNMKIWDIYTTVNS